MADIGKRALITGINGFTGLYMAAELAAAGYQLFGLGSIASDEQNYFQVDLTDLNTLSAVVAQVQPHVVIHLAAIAFVGYGDANAFYEINLIGSRNLLEALSHSGLVPDAVLLASSANVYGNSREGQLDESTPLNPANDYAVSKAAMESMARLWLDKLPVILTRPFNYTGIGQGVNFLLPKIVQHFKERKPVLELGNLDVWRDFTDVRALVKAYRGLIESHAIGQTVNVCSGQMYSLREVVAMCAAITGHQLKITVNPAFVRANEVKTLCGDASKLRSIIGNWSTPSLEDTLRWMLES
jgi:nucleoside-diphosphate-sugar epimerase